jgi:threonine aldolase
MIYFSSENFDGAHPLIMAAVADANKEFVPSYGEDRYTEEAIRMCRDFLGTEDADVFFCFNGTGANNFALSCLTEKYQSVYCSDVSHLYNAESTAPETFTGCRLYPVNTRNGKIVPEDLRKKINRQMGIHLPVPAVITITQPTEYGTVYDLDELTVIRDICKEAGLLLHIDGARIFHALASLNCSLASLINASGADVITIGGTKAGLLFGEAVVFISPDRFKNIRYQLKRSMQLASKNRFIAAQFMALFHDQLWSTIANYTNGLASYCKQEIEKIDTTLVTYPVETNMVFLVMPRALYHQILPVASLYYWDTDQQEVRLAFSFSNTRDEIDSFIQHLKTVLEKDSRCNST